MAKKRGNKIKLGLALGAGGAKGLAHIGILKVLHKHKIYPDYLAGTSMGSIIGALYASGYSPKELKETARTTNWKKIVDFTIPKAGFIQGDLIESKLKRLVQNKDFSELDIPLRVVSYNLDTHEKVVISKGSVSRSLRASISIPGIFTPIKIDKNHFIDGAVVDPTPFDVVKEMGAEIVIAVDLFNKAKTVSGPVVKSKSLLSEFREMFIVQELLNIKNYIFPDRWPGFIKKTLRWAFDKFLYPAKVLKILAGKELPPLAQVMYETINVLTNNLARERMKNADIDFKISPIFKNLTWSDFDKTEEMIKVGERAMNQRIPELKKKLGIK
jgi:predicted acylesterase/phospholipase RssA